MVALPLTQASPFRFLTPEEAAEQTGFSAAELLKRAEAGKILSGMFEDTLRIAVTQDGQVVEIAPTPQDDHGDDINARLSQIRREDFAHLEGIEVGMSEAAREFGVPYQVLQRWIRRGYIKVLRQKGRYKFLDKGDVAFCVAVYRARKPFGSRAPLLDENGNPYLIKYPDLAKARRQG